MKGLDFFASKLYLTFFSNSKKKYFLLRKQPFHLKNEGEITDIDHILPDSQILLSSLRNCIFTDTCSILYFFDVLKSYDADSFISGNTVVTRDPRVAPYHRIQKMSVFLSVFSVLYF